MMPWVLPLIASMRRRPASERSKAKTRLHRLFGNQPMIFSD
jgi:hypothetical protein